MSFRRDHLKWYLILFLVLINAVIWYTAYRLEHHPLLVAFLNVGQGDAIFIEAPDGNQLLVDGGPNAAVLRELGRVMPFFDRSIDVVMETHPDADHIGGLPEVLSRFKVSYFITPGIPNDTPQFLFLTNAKRVESGLRELSARRGMTVLLGRGVYLDILFPDRDVATIETNTGSIVARLRYGDTSVLLTGDSPSSIEQYLESLNKQSLKSTVLKVGHHGSKTSTSQKFVEAVDPQFAIISAGKDNRYGHPHKSVIDVLNNAQVKHYSTAEEGTIRFVSDGTVFTKK